MAEEIRDCLPPDRNPRRPTLALPSGSIDTHVHVFAPPYKLSPHRGYNPPPSTLADLKHLHATLRLDRVVFHPAVGLRRRQLRDPRRHGGAQCREPEPRPRGGGSDDGHPR
jgi:hypothetical protein